MRKIVPFNNVLNFSTDVCEITAISLEHDINMTSDLISGQFHITGEYKITDGDILREKFSFDLPFDIALGQEYDRDTLVVDIDDFRYELIERNKLKVNIDLYIDGEILEEVREEYIECNDKIDKDGAVVVNDDRNRDEEVELMKDEEIVIEEGKDDLLSDDGNEIDNRPIINEVNINELSEYTELKDGKLDKDVVVNEVNNAGRIELLDEMLNDKEEKKMANDIESNESIENNDVNNNNNNNNNIFSGFNEEEKYVTYRVHRVMDGDTVDKLLEEYGISKEELAKYNAIENIKPGDKLIIPTNDK